MEIKAGMYYRRKVNDTIVKVLHEKVFMGPYSDDVFVVYRIREGRWPTRSEVVPIENFSSSFEGPLDWDTALQEFK